MKKIFTLSIITAITALFITGCVRDSVGDSENYWLTKERGEVVFRDANCGYIVVETNYGYTVIRLVSGSRPYEGSIIYGEFGQYGVMNFYNYSSGIIITGDVVEVDLTYTEAQLAVDYYCPYTVGYKIRQNAVSTEKQKRPVE